MRTTRKPRHRPTADDVRSPSYLDLLAAGELDSRTSALVSRLDSCDLCPRRCGTNRAAGASDGWCRTGVRPRVSAAYPHFGEESVLVGKGGSGTVFFCECNLRCVFCQNEEISHGGGGREVEADGLAALFLGLQAAGCENINLVTPSHVPHAILEAVGIAARRGLRLPLVWNSSGFESIETLRALDGVVDVYLPDFKSSSPDTAGRLLNAPDYPDVARAAIAEMHRQVGDLIVDDDGVARRGLLVRHLVMPGATADASEVVSWLASLSPDTTVSVMDQYRPLAGASMHRDIARRATADEVEAVRTAVLRAGVRMAESGTARKEGQAGTGTTSCRTWPDRRASSRRART